MIVRPRTGLGDVITDLRRRAGLLQAELANLAGVSRQTVINLETGQSRGTMGTMVKLVDALIAASDERSEEIWREIGLHLAHPSGR